MPTIPYTQPTSPEDAIRIQNELRHKVVLHDDFDAVKTIAGIDCSFDIDRDLSRAVIVLIDAETMDLITSVVAIAPTVFPYVPGLLSFREIPVILEALACLPQQPDFLMVDGQGIAHPRRLGIAAHLGVITGLPAIGIGKSLLCGKYDEPGAVKGAQSPLIHKGDHIGTVLRSKEKCNPLFISPGHRVSMETAVAMAERYLTTYRLPEPTRIADKISKFKPAKAANVSETALLL